MNCVEFFIFKKLSVHIDFSEQPLNSLCAAVKITVLTAAFKVKNEVWTSAFGANVDEKPLSIQKKNNFWTTTITDLQLSSLPSADKNYIRELKKVLEKLVNQI